MKRLKSIAVAAFAAVAAVTLAWPTLPASAASSASLSIMPRRDYVIEPGKPIDDTLVIRNLDQTIKLELTLRVVDFTFMDEGGTPKLFLEEDKAPTAWSLRPFLTAPKHVTVAPGGSKKININVNIPENYEAGSYYSAILYASGAPSGGNVGLSASGVTLLFANIPGDVHEDLELKKLGAYDERKKNYLFITTKKPEMLAYTLKNNGNVTEAPVGSITLKGWFGKQTINNINPADSLALIGQTRTFTRCLKLKTEEGNLAGESIRSQTCVEPDLWPGRYTVELSAFYGHNGNPTKHVTGTAVFWYLPIWFITLLLILLLVIAYIVWRIKRFVQRLRDGTLRKRSRRRR